MLNAILDLNPKAAQKRHIINGGTEETFTNHEGKLPFDVVFWVCEVAAQLGIKSKEEMADDPMEAAANARLIAAAPDMLVALLAAELVLSQGGAHEGSLVLLGIRAALAKAEGK